MAKMAKIFKNIINNKWLVVIFVLALVFRLYNLNKVPYAFDGDEAAFGYYGYSLLNNFSDEYGNKLPLYFPSIGDYKYPVYAYLSAIPVFLFGLSEFSTRFLSAISGSILIIVIYSIVYNLSKRKDLGLITAATLAFSPYGIIFSRGAYESNLAVLFISVGIYLVLRSISESKSKFIYLSLVPFVLAIFTYSSARAFLLMFLPILAAYIYFYYKPFKKQKFKSVLIVTITVCLISLLSFLDPRSLIRAKSVNVFNDPLNSKVLSEQILEDGRHNPGKYLIFTRAFHNKPVVFTVNFIKRYFEHFNPVYLFVESNPTLNKYSVPQVGLFHFFEFFTILLGISTLTKINKKLIIIPIWILISVIPSALTIETPNPIRTLTGLPAWIMLSSVGIYGIISHFNKYVRITYFTIGLVFVFSSFYFFHQYFVHDVTHEPWYTDGGVKEMVIESTRLSYEFDKVIVPQDPYIFFLFYNRIAPNDFLSDSARWRIFFIE